MCEFGEKLKNVGERSKAEQKLNREKGISGTKLKLLMERSMLRTILVSKEQCCEFAI